jgi:AraC-like DNA-binding protein
VAYRPERGAAMTYREILPHPALRAWVDRFWLRVPDPSEVKGAVGPDCVLPDGCVDVLIELEPRAVHVVGTMTRALWVDVRRLSMAAVRFRPGAAAALLGVAAHELTDRRVPLGDLGSSWLLPRTWDAGSPREAVALLEASLLARLDRVRLRPEVARAVQLCFGAPPPSVAVLASEVGWTRQRLTRVLLEEVGISTKQLLRVARLQRAVDQLQRFPSASLAQAAAGLGYTDQAHMCRDFRELVGSSPAAVRAAPHTIFPIRSLLGGA